LKTISFGFAIRRGGEKKMKKHKKSVKKATEMKSQSFLIRLDGVA
jgi:hypothetical protein